MNTTQNELYEKLLNASESRMAEEAKKIPLRPSTKNQKKVDFLISGLNRLFNPVMGEDIESAIDRSLKAILWSVAEELAQKK